MSAPEFVVVREAEVRGVISPLYLTKRGRSFDPAIKAEHLRDWVPLLATDMVETFASQHEAQDQAYYYGGRVQDRLDAEQIELGRGGLIRLQDSGAPDEGFGL